MPTTDAAHKSNLRGTVSEDYSIFVRVVAVGNGYYDPETGKDIPLEARPGQIVLVGVASVKWFTSFGDMTIKGEGKQIGITHNSEVRFRFKDDSAYEKGFRILNETLENQ